MREMILIDNTVRYRPTDRFFLWPNKYYIDNNINDDERDSIKAYPATIL